MLSRSSVSRTCLFCFVLLLHWQGSKPARFPGNDNCRENKRQFLGLVKEQLSGYWILKREFFYKKKKCWSNTFSKKTIIRINNNFRNYSNVLAKNKNFTGLNFVL